VLFDARLYNRRPPECFLLFHPVHSLPFNLQDWFLDFVLFLLFLTLHSFVKLDSHSLL
jgi:hypothetical protein